MSDKVARDFERQTASCRYRDVVKIWYIESRPLIRAVRSKGF